MNLLPPTHTRRRWTLAAHTSALAVLFAMGFLMEAPAARSTEATYLNRTGKGLPFPHRKLANVTFVAFDTETTGVNPHRDRIVELAAVKYQDGKIIDERTWLVNPGRPIPSWAQKVHGITTEMVKNEPKFKDIYAEFLEFIGGSVLVAHNAPFDISFINTEVRLAHLESPPNLVIDSLGLFRTWFPNLKSYSLEKVATSVDIPKDIFHRALADSMYVALIFNKGARKLDASAKLKDVYADAGGPLGFYQ